MPKTLQERENALVLLLHHQAKALNVKLEDVGLRCGMSRTTLYLRLRQPGTFRLEEFWKMCVELAIPLPNFELAVKGQKSKNPERKNNYDYETIYGEDPGDRFDAALDPFQTNGGL
jgi:hypothetical protein